MFLTKMQKINGIQQQVIGLQFLVEAENMIKEPEIYKLQTISFLD